MTHKLVLDIVTQETRLVTVEATQVTVETTSGEITILPGHIPLVSRLREGLLRYLDEKGNEQVIAIFGGFLELGEDGKLSILADSAVRAEDIDLAAVKRAEQEAQSALADKGKERDFALAEAALRHAALQLRATEHRNRHRSS
jgi:F-type H+-transporting ATPase subunit epsilon